MASPPVKSIGDYRVINEIARGAMGVVYCAQDPRLDRKVAVKVILAREADECDVARFRREARVTARLRHPNIVGIQAAGSVQGKPYIVMDLIEGGSLADLLKQQGALKGVEAARIVEEVARAVDYAHGRGVLHRDIKPANVLLDEQGEPQLTDFGLAKLMGRDTKITLSGEITGTPVYMAPEQALGDKEKIGPLTDVYALGATLYQLVTGQPPFLGTTVVGVLREVIESAPVAPSKILASVDSEMEEICLQALAKDPADRYLSAAAMAEALADYRRSRGEREGDDGDSQIGAPAPQSGASRGVFVMALAGFLAALGLGVAWRSAVATVVQNESDLIALRSELNQSVSAQADGEALLQSVQTELEEAQERSRADLLRVAELDAEVGDLQARVAERSRPAPGLGVAHLEAVLQATGKTPSALFVAAQVRLAYDNEDPRGLSDLKRVLAADPSNVRARVLLGRTLFLTQQDGEAEQALSVAIGARGTTPAVLAWALCQRAWLYQHRGRAELVDADLTAAGVLAPREAVVPATQGRVLAWRLQPEEALRAFGAALKLDPRYPWTYSFRGLLYLSQKKYALAKADYQNALRWGLVSFDVHLYLGQAQLFLNEVAKAKDSINRSLDRVPTAAGFAYRAVARLRLRNLAGAREDLARARRAQRRRHPALVQGLLADVASMLRDGER